MHTLCGENVLFFSGFGGFKVSGSGAVFLLSQPWRNGTVQHDYASHILTNCQRNNKQRTCVAPGANMHAQILVPLKLCRRTLLPHLPGAIHAAYIKRGNVAATWPVSMGEMGWLVSYCSHMTTPISVTGRNVVCVGNCICLINKHCPCTVLGPWVCVYV